MNAQQLKNAILQEAIEGRLVPQDPNDEPASVLLQRIRAEKERLVKEGKLKKKDLVETPISEDEKPFEIPESWEWVRLKTISSSVSDGDHMPPPKADSGIPFLVISNIIKGYIDFSNTRFVPQSYYDNITLDRKAEKGDVLFTVTGSYGKAVLNDTDSTFCFQRHIALIKPLIYSAYVELILNSPYIKAACDDKATGMAQKTVGIDTLRSFVIPLPPLAEQKRIVAKIEELMPKVEEYGKAQEALDKLNEELPERLKKSVLQEAITGRLVPQDPNDEPASVLLQRIRAEKERLVKEGKLKKKDLVETPISEEEKPFEIPESWGFVRLGEITYNHGQKTPSDDFSYIDIGSIDNKCQKLNDSETIIKAKDAPSRAKKIVELGDVLYATVRPYLHNMCIIDRVFDKEPIASTGFAVMTCVPGLYNKFLFYYLLSPIFDDYANDGDNAKGVAYPAINDKKLYNGVVPLPPLAEQKRIVAKIEELFAVLDSIKESLEA